MSMLKMVPDGLKARECKRIKLCEPPPVPYVPVKDEVQDEVARMRSMEIKTTLEKDTTLNFAVWQENRTREAFLMYVTAVLDAIKKRGHLDDYEKAMWQFEKSKEAVETTRAGLLLLQESVRKSSKEKKKTKEGKKVAPAKAPEPVSAAKEAKVAPAANDDMKASFSSDLENAKQSQRSAKGAMTVAASKMFLFYLNLLSPESKYAWNKIVIEQTEGDPYVNLQGDTLEGPRGMLRQLFHDCMTFHLLTAFPINAAEQEKYYITNVLKKPQHVNVRQFVRQVEQLNAYIIQMPCFYYSPNANASTKPENVLFPEAELGAHVLHMCPLAWQDQYNLNQKGMTPMDMRMLLLCRKLLNTYVPMRGASRMRNPRNLPSTERKENNGQVLILRPAFPRKSDLRRIATCVRNMGAHIPFTRLVNVVSMRMTELKNLVPAPLRKAVRKTIL
jgi:hypothetical protein